MSERPSETGASPCAAYAEPRLVAVYDPLNPADHDYRFYRALAGPGPLRTLDVGAGTGRLAAGWAEDGHAVTAVEPAGAMLAAGKKRCADAVAWVEAGAADFKLETRFDLIVMTGHVFQVFLADQEVRAVLANLRAHLAVGGRLAFETRNPLVREWESWVPAQTSEEVAVPGVGTVDVHYDIQRVEGERVTFETHFRFPDGGRERADHTLRFMPRDRLAEFLVEAGFSTLEWFGDWDRSPWRPGSPEIIVIAGSA